MGQNIGIYPPKVFISYTYDSPEHERWVEKLARNLCNPGGVDVIFDKWDARLGDNLPFFMEQGLSNAHVVLCICSDKYVQKANEGLGGAGYEKKIMTQYLMENANKEFVIPIMVNNVNKKLPTFLFGDKYIEFHPNDYYGSFRDLLYRIHGKDKELKPAISANPFSDKSFLNELEEKINLSRVEFQSQETSGFVTFDYKRNSGNYSIGTNDYHFDLSFSECGYKSIYVYRDRVKYVGIANNKAFPTTDEIKNDIDFTSRCRQVSVGDVFVVVNKHGKVAAVKIVDITKKNDNSQTVIFEYHIYDDMTLNN
ncbi:MAG: toll/interleukin-1 receptor domain-containing protein [Bacteroidales bacterium]|nr:toll/interleukin-1 receptor domain-containing protein [Bacteroidales bacterium]